VLETDDRSRDGRPHRAPQPYAGQGSARRITRADVMTVDDVAELLDLKPYTVKEYARRGILPGRKLGRGWRFLRPELEDAIRRLPKPGR